MPTIFIFEGLKFNIYFNDHQPPHVHVTKNGVEAVFRLSPTICILKSSLSPKDEKKARSVIEEKYEDIMHAWEVNQNV